MVDNWNVVVAYDKPSYNPGDIITMTVTGYDTLVQTNTRVTGNRTRTNTTTTLEPIKVVQISDPSGRVWTIGPTGLSATATA